MSDGPSQEYMVMAKLKKLYCFNISGYAFMRPDGEYLTTYEELTEAVLFEHLDGKRTVCVHAGKWQTIFMTFDVDEDDKEHVRALVLRLAELGIRYEDIHVSTSGNKGYHVDLFFDEPVHKWLIENFYDYVRRDPEIAAIHMECRPINSTTIKIPLGINFRTGRRCWYVDRDTLAPIEDFGYILGISPMSGAMFRELVRKLNKQRMLEDLAIAKVNTELEKKQPKVIAGDGVRITGYKNEPVITHPGERHNLTLRKAVWLRSVGADEDQIYEELWRWTERQNQDLISSSWQQIDDDIREITGAVMRNIAPKLERYKTIGYGGARLLTEEDIQKILPINKKSSRKVAMLITLYCKAYKSCALGLDKIGSIIGLSHPTVQTAVQQLIQDGVINKKKTGGLCYQGDKPVLRPNEYVLSEKAKRDRKITAKANVSYTVPEVIEDFEHFYYAALAEMCDRKTLAKYLSAAEMKEIKKYEEDAV